MLTYSLSGKSVLVTGASSGIGRAASVAVSKQGATCVLAARDVGRLNQTAALCDGAGHTILSLDLSEDEARARAVAEMPLLDGVIYCAGVADNQVPLKFIKRELVDRIIDVNLKAPMLLLAELARARKLNKGASVLFITSFSPLHGSPAHATYMASKAGLYGFVRGAALDLAPRKIRVNAIAPASVNTPLINFAALTEEQRIANEASYPLGRYGEPDDIAAAIVYFMSDESAWVTGTQFVMDGGKSL